MTNTETVVDVLRRSGERAEEVGAQGVCVLILGRDGTAHYTEFNFSEQCVEDISSLWHAAPAGGEQ